MPQLSITGYEPLPDESKKQPQGAAAPQGLAIVGYEPERQPERSVGKTVSAFWEGIGGRALMDLMAGAGRTKEGAERTKAAIQGLAQGVAAEPGRVWRELSGAGEAMIKADLPGFAYRMGSAVPFLGAGAQQITDELQRGAPAEALGHTAALVAPFVAGKAGAAAGRLATAAAERAAPAIEVAGAGARAAAPDVATGAAKVGAGYLLEQMLPGGGPLKYAFELPTAYQGARQIQRGLKKGVKAGREVLKTRAAAAAEAAKAEAAAAEAAASAQAAQEAPRSSVVYGAPGIIPPSRQLGPGPIVTPAPPDTSYVRAVPAELPEVIPPGVWRRPGAMEQAEQLRREMEASGTIGPPAAAGEPATVIATEAPAVAPKAAPAGTAAEIMAQALFDHGIPLSDVRKMSYNDWRQVATATGQRTPSSAIQRDALVTLERLEKAERTLPAATALMSPAEAEKAFQEQKARATRRKKPSSN